MRAQKRPRTSFWYDWAMQDAEEESIARKKARCQRTKERRQQMKKSIPLCKPFRQYFSGLDTQEELERWEREGIVKYVLNTGHDGYLASATLAPDGTVQQMIADGESVMNALVFETYHEGLLAQVQLRYPHARYESVPHFGRRGEVKMEENVDVNKIMELILAEAERRELSTAGVRGDNGAMQLRDQVFFYQKGMHGEMPTAWKKYEKMLDPEYAEWQRLNKKFGGQS